MDCFQISKYLKNRFEKSPIHEEIEFVVEFLEYLRDCFSSTEMFLIEGNHEKRFKSYLYSNAPELSELKGMSIQEQLELDRFKIKYINNLELLQAGKKPFSIGELYFLHGHEIPGSGVNVARSKYMKVQNNIIFGHHHTNQQYTHKRFTTVRGSWSVGCLCSVNPEYAPVNQHIQGFAVVEFENDGTFKVKNRMIINGKVM